MSRGVTVEITRDTRDNRDNGARSNARGSSLLVGVRIFLAAGPLTTNVSTVWRRSAVRLIVRLGIPRDVGTPDAPECSKPSESVFFRGGSRASERPGAVYRVQLFAIPVARFVNRRTLPRRRFHLVNRREIVQNSERSTPSGPGLLCAASALCRERAAVTCAPFSLPLGPSSTYSCIYYL